MSVGPARLIDGDGRAFRVVAFAGNVLVAEHGGMTLKVLHHIERTQDWRADSIPGFAVELENPRDVIAQWPDADDIVGVHAVDEVPDSSFFEVWTFADRRVQIDIPKARNIWRDQMRRAREPLLAALDVDYLRADENGDELMKRDVMARKKELRDVTREAAIERAETPDELKRCWPSCLGDRPVGVLGTSCQRIAERTERCGCL
jgi:hypothetical protein